MSDSILTSVKKNLGIHEDDDSFDPDVTIFINSAFATLNQLGVGPDDGFEIVDASSKWDDFTDGDPKLNGVKNYVTLKVRIVFDPPATSFVLAALEEQVKELEYRLNIYVEGRDYVGRG